MVMAGLAMAGLLSRLAEVRGRRRNALGRGMRAVARRRSRWWVSAEERKMEEVSGLHFGSACPLCCGVCVRREE
jgi:hypothetical protein